MNCYSVTIIGLGNIGMLYDYNEDSENIFLTHLKSFSYHRGFRIVNVIDQDREKLELAKTKLGNSINFLKSVSELKIPTDLFVLSSSPGVNLQIYHQFKDDLAIKFFLIEKPFWVNKSSFSEQELFSESIYINYIRKNLPFVKELKRRISEYKYGKVLGVHAYYSKGLCNNGSHLIDLIIFLFDSEFDLTSIKEFGVVHDHLENDPSYSFKIDCKYSAGEFPIIFQALDERSFSLIEFDLIFESARFRFYEFGTKVEVFYKDSDKLFSGYENLTRNKVIKTGLEKYALFTCENIYNILENKMTNNSNLKNEESINKIIEKIRDER